MLTVVVLIKMVFARQITMALPRYPHNKHVGRNKRSIARSGARREIPADVENAISPEWDNNAHSKIPTTKPSITPIECSSISPLPRQKELSTDDINRSLRLPATSAQRPQAPGSTSPGKTPTDFPPPQLVSVNRPENIPSA